MSQSSILISAPKADVEGALANLESYPTWSSGIKAVVVEERDENNRPTKATCAIDAGVMKDRVTLEYNWHKAPAEITFSLLEADLLTEMDGKILISGTDDEVKVSYELTVALSLPVPSQMREKTELATITQFLNQLKEKVEG